MHAGGVRRHTEAERMNGWKLNHWVGTGLLAIAATALAAEKPAEPPKPDAAKAEEQTATAGGGKVLIDGWTYSRERKTITGSNRVTALFKVKNITGQNLDNVVVAVTYQSGLGEKVGGPLSQQLGALKAGETKQAQLSGEFIPTFGSYQILVTYAGGKEEWIGPSDMANPTPKGTGEPDTGANLMVLGQEVGPDKFNRLAGQLRIKNSGKLEATNCKVLVMYYAQPPQTGKDGKLLKAVKLGEWAGPLGSGKFPPQVERVVPLQVPQPMPRGASHYEIKVSCDESATELQLSGGDFTNVKDVEVSKFQFKRTGAKQEDLEVACQFRNGLSEPQSNIKLSLEFFVLEKGAKKSVKTHKEALPITIKPGEIVPHTFTITGMPKYDSYEQAIEYGAPGAGSGTASAKPAELTFKNQATVEVLLKTFSTGDDGTVAVVCAARNGRPATVKDIEIVVRFFDATGKEIATGVKILPDPVPSGEVRNFIIRAENAKGYAASKSEVKFKEEKPAVAADNTAAVETPKP